MTEQNPENNKALKPEPPEKGPGAKLDVADKSLSEALRISFIILKIIMIVLVALFLLSGFETVGSDERALVLRFGKIRGIGENRLLDPGLHWVRPYPIDEIIKIPAAKKVNLAINSFWYYQKKDEWLPEGPEKTRVEPSLAPVRDGYCITRGEKHIRTVVGSAGSDYNIVHSRWQLTYQIDDPERFFKNIHIDDVKPGESYAEVIAKSVAPMLEYLVADSVVTAMVHYTIDEAISSQATIPAHVKKLLQSKLDTIQAGIKVVSVQLTHSVWPRQVNEAFQASIQASQASQKAISEARGYAENTLNQAGGPVAARLLVALKGETVPESETELLWSQLAGAARGKIASARAYRTRVIENAKANADYLQRLLPEYRKRPKLVIQKIYQDTVEYVLNNADEKMIIQPTEGTRGKEIRILLNRDPAIKPKSED